MRNTLISVIALIVFASSPIYAQEAAPAPFAELDKQVKEQQGGWSGSKQPLATIFNAERKRLGKDFETELEKYIGTDVEKHDWVSSFLIAPSYLHGNKPLPNLSLYIKNKALSLLRNKEDERSLGYVVKLSITAALVSESIQLRSLATAYKEEAERLLSKNPDLRTWFPWMNEEERKLYDSIPSKYASSAPAPASTDEPKARVMGGILNGKALKLPAPEYPSEARGYGASGEVRVKIVVDETGKVIWARAISGHERLQKAAQDAAYKATFQPLILGGKPEKVMGFLIYRFVYR